MKKNYVADNDIIKHRADLIRDRLNINKISEINAIMLGEVMIDIYKACHYLKKTIIEVMQLIGNKELPYTLKTDKKGLNMYYFYELDLYGFLSRRNKNG